MFTADKRKLYKEKLASGEWRRHPKYDAYYEVSSGEWIEQKCCIPDCEFCKDRPINALRAY